MNKRKRWWIAGAVGGLMLLYLLSVGPVVALALRFFDPAHAIFGFIDAFYAPIVWMAKHSVWAAHGFDAYRRLWGIL
jgi:hypothetical protein